MSITDLNNNPAILDGIIFRMVQMSEHIDKVSDLLKSLHQEIHWLEIKGFRNRLVHDYGGIDLEFVYNAISKDIYILKIQLEKIINR